MNGEKWFKSITNSILKYRIYAWQLPYKVYNFTKEQYFANRCSEEIQNIELPSFSLVQEKGLKCGLVADSDIACSLTLTLSSQYLRVISKTLSRFHS